MQDTLETIFWSVSDPKHANYGKFLSREELSELVSPDPEDLEAILDWLEENGNCCYVYVKVIYL